MTVAFLFKEGILEYTARVLVETALPKLKYDSFENADYIFVFNQNLRKGLDNEICVYKETDSSDFLTRVLYEVKNRFPNMINKFSFNNLKWFSKSFCKIESSDLISDVVLSYREHNVDVINFSKEELVDLLTKNVKFTSKVDEMLGVKLHLYANHSKLESYYKWLSYKFKKLYMHNKVKCGNKFFTQSEIDSFYRSLASKVRYINYILDDGTADVIERRNEIINGVETIYIIKVSSINRALNEVLLKSEEIENLIVCCKSNSIALYSYWDGDRIVHRSISNKSKVERVVEYIEPLGN